MIHSESLGGPFIILEQSLFLDVIILACQNNILCNHYLVYSFYHCTFFFFLFKAIRAGIQEKYNGKGTTYPDVFW